MRLLLQAGADVHRKDDILGWTPLRFAAGDGGSKCLQCCKLLLAAGAEIDAKDKKGETVLQSAEKRGSIALVELLKKYQKKESN